MNVDRMRRSPIIHGPRRRFWTERQLGLDPDAPHRWLQAVARGHASMRRDSVLNVNTWQDSERRGRWFAWEIVPARA